MVVVEKREILVGNRKLLVFVIGFGFRRIACYCAICSRALSWDDHVVAALYLGLLTVFAEGRSTEETVRGQYTKLIPHPPSLSSVLYLQYLLSVLSIS